MPKNKKKIVFITGTRADYGKIKPLMKAVEQSPLFELFVFVSGMHLLEIFGHTYEEVLKDGYKNIYVAYGLNHSNKMSVNLGETISHFSGYIDNIKPDLIVVHGDRIDALSGAVVGALNNILVAHIEGGEVSGTIDESIRHAVSKFSHLHFVSNRSAKERLLQLGEHKDTVFIIGSPDIDIMMSRTLPTLKEAKKRYDIRFDRYGIMIYHPVTTEHKKIRQHIREVVNAAIRSERNFIVIYPNNDTGSELILSEYTRFAEHPRFRVFESLRFEHFLTLLKNADLMLGNSSAGIREAGIYGVPVIDIGTRQQGRYSVKEHKNIIHTEEDTEMIISALKKLPSPHHPAKPPFGKGDSAINFMKIISHDTIWKKNIQKVFIDIKGVFND